MTNDKHPTSPTVLTAAQRALLRKIYDYGTEKLTRNEGRKLTALCFDLSQEPRSTDSAGALTRRDPDSGRTVTLLPPLTPEQARKALGLSAPPAGDAGLLRLLQEARDALNMVCGPWGGARSEEEAKLFLTKCIAVGTDTLAKLDAALSATRPDAFGAASVVANRSLSGLSGDGSVAEHKRPEPWWGHRFSEFRKGIWTCDCGKTIHERGDVK